MTCKRHTWKHLGGKNAGCELDSLCTCSVPVMGCPNCGDSDYGDTDDNTRIIADCRRKRLGVTDLRDELTEDVDIEMELSTANAEAECKEFTIDEGLELGYGENCPTPNKFDFCRYCCWRPDPIDQFWERQRVSILREATIKMAGIDQPPKRGC